ncbi:MAG: hypothetical protein JWR26_4252 [Pedosphaera sp.]|nr:hypothetical protein [Pedosphaera sp.]
MNTTIFGIRHHGPGSARSLREALEALKPDCILIEGPPEAEEVLSFAVHEEKKPPVALLIYDPEKPQRSAFYPFAVFSPEWQAMQFGLSRKAPVHFMDLPQSIHMGLAAEAEAKLEAEPPDLNPSAAVEQPEAAEEEDDSGMDSPEAPSLPVAINLDPLSHLARAAGYSDSERWWEHMVEHRRDGKEIFGAVLEAMTALREAAIQSSLQQLEPERETRREAHMRQTIRTAQKEGFQRIAVVCGAWHAPALAQMPPAKDDAALLKGLPKRKVVATWIPWTYSRLASASGYGAGIESPGWYDFLWSLRRHQGQRVATHWLTKVARLLRKEDLDASSASIIEAVRLAESLAALRGRPLPGLPELNEATQTVLCFGDVLPLRLIAEKLIVSERLGEIPADIPMVPLAQDLAREQKRLRLPSEALQRQLDLDLRKPNELDRSRLLHRLKLLGVEWGKEQRQRGVQKGTFHELWVLQWEPEFAVTLIEAGVWGNTIPGAAGAKVRHEADDAPDLPALTALLDSTLLADLPEAAEHLMSRLQAVAAVASDVGHLMGALPPLANILRYGNVRQTDATMVSGIVNGLMARICIGLPGACGSLNDEAAEDLFEKILASHAAIGLLQNAEYSGAWNAVLRQLVDSPNLHGLIAGRACRLLLEAQQLTSDEAARRLGLALSPANVPAQAGAWIDGFLRNSGLLLLHDDSLWRVLDDWVSALKPDYFTNALPLLRRTFSTFESGERRQIGGRVATGKGRGAMAPASSDEFDEERANKVLPLLAQLLGLKTEVKQ